MRVFFAGAGCKNQVTDFIRNNCVLIVNTFSLVAGIGAGAALLRIDNTDESLITSMVDTYASSLEGKSFLSFLTDSFFSILPYLVAIYLLAFTAFGFISAVPLLLFRGMGLGMTLGCLCLNNSFKGIAFGCLVLIPPAVATSVVLILACCDCNVLSLRLANLFRRGTRCLSLHHELTDINIRFLKYLLVCIIASVLSASLSIICPGLLNF